jgi:hypothetical protein
MKQVIDLLEKYKMYLDSKGLIVQQNGDGGDTLQREGFWFEGVTFNFTPLPQGMAPYTNALKILSTPSGFVRSWQTPYNNPSDTSRDQLVSNIRSLGYLKSTLDNLHYTFLNQIFLGVIKNFSRFPNGDIAFINDYGRFIRAFKSWYLFPLLLIFDLPLLINALLICFWLTRTPSRWQVWLASKASWLFWLTNQYPPNAEGVSQSPYGPTNTSNDINFIGDLTQAQKIYPTPISFIARKIYRYFRPYGAPFALASYFSVASGGNIQFALLWKPIVEKF